MAIRSRLWNLVSILDPRSPLQTLPIVFSRMRG